MIGQFLRIFFVLVTAVGCSTSLPVLTSLPEEPVPTSPEEPITFAPATPLSVTPVTEHSLPSVARPYVQAMLPEIQALATLGTGNSPMAKRLMEKAKRQAKMTPSIPRGDRKEARKLNQIGLASLRAEQYSDATESFHLAMNADSSDVEIANNLGYALYKERRFKESRRFLLMALAISPDRASAWMTLGELFSALDEKPNALSAFSNALEFSRDREKADRYLWNIAETPGTHERAREWALEVIRIYKINRPASL